MSGSLPLARLIDVENRTYGALIRDRAAHSGERVFMTHQGTSYSFASLDDITDRVATALALAGVADGSHIALILPNCPELVWAYFALAKLGAVAVPLNPAARGDVLRHQLSHARCSGIIGTPPMLDHAVAAWPNLASSAVQISVHSDHSPQIDHGAVPFDALLHADRNPPTDVARFDDPFCLLYTSGTTGPAKAVVSPHYHGIDYALERSRRLGYREDDVLFSCLPLFHGNALFGACISALVLGATMALSERFSVTSFWTEIRDSGANAFNALGAMTTILWNAPSSASDREHAVRTVTAVPMPPFAAGFEERFGVTLTSVYALSDFGLATVFGPDEPRSLLGSAGRVRDGVAVAILDEVDRPQPSGAAGEIALRCLDPWVSAPGYYDDPEASLRANRNHWFHTGDRGYLDDDGYLHFVDRQKDTIRRRGENISAWEVEKVVGDHPLVAEVAAFAVPSELSEDEVAVAVVSSSSALEPLTLIEHCIGRMAHFMVPRFVLLVDELPKNASHKVLKGELRDRFDRARESVWDREEFGVDVPRA